MGTSASPCVICRGRLGDPELRRVQVWEDAAWRLTVASEGEIAGFAYLEPKRHIPHITDLDSVEARTFGAVLREVAQALKEATAADLVYVYVFGGGIPHLHVHLAPHTPGDCLSEQMIRGEVIETKLPSGALAYVSKDFPPLPKHLHEKVRARLTERLKRGKTVN